MGKLKLAIVGRHAARTPFSYSVYKQLFGDYFSFTDDAYKADVIVVGFSVDLDSITADYPGLIKNNPHIKFFVFSEEPLWDCLSPNAIDCIEQEWHTAEGLVKFRVFNHLNSDVFNFERIPYFLTTESSYIARYLLLYKQLLQAHTPSSLLEYWQSKGTTVHFVQQQRLQAQYGFYNPRLNVYGLSKFRSLLCECLLEENVSVDAQSVTSNGVRQALPDWHLDKIIRLQGKTSLLSAMENTLISNYVTEKIFDAFALGAMPVYYADQAHRVFELVDEGTFVNLYGLSVPDSVELLKNHNFKLEQAERYLDNVQALHTRFAHFESLHSERMSVVRKVCSAILSA